MLLQGLIAAMLNSADNANCNLEEELTRKVKSTFERLQRGTGTLNLTLLGNTSLFAEGKLTVLGLRPGVDGTWNITKVEHSLSNSGYSCQVEAETPTN